jgi:hypothetical protein
VRARNAGSGAEWSAYGKSAPDHLLVSKPAATGVVVACQAGAAWCEMSLPRRRGAGGLGRSTMQ